MSAKSKTHKVKRQSGTVMGGVDTVPSGTLLSANASPNQTKAIKPDEMPPPRGHFSTLGLNQKYSNVLDRIEFCFYCNQNVFLASQKKKIYLLVMKTMPQFRQ